MANRVVFLFLVLGLVVPLISLAQSNESDDDVPDDFSRSYFPSDFLWGSSSAAYQYEGQANKSGRGPSIWDIYSHECPHRIADGSNGDIATDFYHKFKHDIQRMKDLQMNAFRFSISWSRVIPSGKIREGVNELGVKFYKKLIDELIKHDIVPFATLFHFDTPQALEDKYGGFLSSNVVADFEDYADFCFKTFGDKVKYWITFNEPHTFSILNYEMGLNAPGRCSNWVNRQCRAGDSATEPYIVAHNQLNAHAAAVKVYRTKYKESQKGKIGIVLSSAWLEPYTNASEDIDASKRAQDFMLGWFLDPVLYGDYPTSMRQRVQDRLPRFTRKQSLSLRGSIDYLGLNYYTAYYAQNLNYTIDPAHVRAWTDNGVEFQTEKNGDPIGPSEAMEGLYVVPWGLRKLLVYVKSTYGNLETIITENGYSDYDNGTMPLEEAMHDTERKEFFRDHFWNCYRAMNESKVNLKGFMLWSLLDNYEWSNGYSTRFGIVHVDHATQGRDNKDSAKWLKHFLSNKATNSFAVYEEK